MSSIKNSKLMLCKNIKMDRSYKNVLNYSESDMVSLCESNVVASATDFTFIRERHSIMVPFTYEKCLESNYIAFQNPSYSSKWFFAWIDEVNYKNNNTTEIVYSVDVWSTWFSYWTPKECLVIREHVNDDSVGLHTVPEGLETGELTCNSHVIDEHMDNIMDDLTYVLSTTVSLYDKDSKDKYVPVTGGYYNGIYSATKYYVLTNDRGVETALEKLAETGQIDAVNGLFMAPKVLAQIVSDMSPVVINSESAQSYTNSISKQTTLNGYTPKNKKLLCYPYNYLIASNNNGASFTYAYEDFNGSNCTFKIYMAITPGCSIRMIPTGYKNVSEGDEYGINMGKLPICSYPCDMYTNWLTQNSINIAGHQISSDDINVGLSSFNAVAGVVSSAMNKDVMGAVSGAVNGAGSVANALITQKQHELIPPQARGNLNAGDVVTASNKNTFHFYKMSIKQEYARILDDYFTRYGYKVNRLKTPNITGRTYFNYIQIGADEIVGTGTLSNTYMEIINNICRAGTTIWHNHSNMFNYNLDNSI